MSSLRQTFGIPRIFLVEKWQALPDHAAREAFLSTCTKGEIKRIARLYGLYRETYPTKYGTRYYTRAMWRRRIIQVLQGAAVENGDVVAPAPDPE